jgi:phosphoribosylamine--glycine ligase
VKILVIGSGGREHAIVWKLAQSPRAPALYCAPGNPGIERLARCVAIAADDVGTLKSFVVSEGIDLTVVGPEAPLARGIVDEFRKDKLKIFGPSRGAARIESSKAFAKELMARHRIPTAAARSFTEAAAALAYLQTQDVPIVVKADGLAQGKGVVVAATRTEAEDAARAMLEARKFGEAGSRIVIEQFLPGEEVTCMAFADGKSLIPMLPAQDHKRVGDGDTGPNTGGMGSLAPASVLTPALRTTIVRTVFQPVLEGLSRVGSPFHGVLYAGLMLAGGRPYVLEFNARMGDPETQVVLPLLKTDLLEVFEAVVEHRLDQLEVEWHDRAAVCVVMASAGYPGSYATGEPIDGPVEQTGKDVVVFHAGTRRDGGRVVTAGGRVLGVTGIGTTLRAARDRAYDTVRSIHFAGRHFRTDIADRAIRAATPAR